MSWLDTHPPPPEYLAALDRAAGTWTITVTRLPLDGQWDALEAVVAELPGLRATGDCPGDVFSALGETIGTWTGPGA